MHEFEEACLSSRCAQLLDEAKRDAAAAMHGHSGGFVDRDQPVVLEQDGRLERPCDATTDAGLARCREPQRRKSEHVAGGNAHIGTDAPLVEPNLAAAQDPVNVALRNALQMPQQEIVDTLPGI